MIQQHAFSFGKFRRSQFGRVAFAMVAVSLMSVQFAAAQGKSPGTSIKGKLVKIEKKGRATTLVVSTADGEKQIPVTSRVDFAVTAKGDEGFLVPGQFISTPAVLANNLLFSKRFIVYVGKGRKPKSQLVKAPKMIGQSVNTWLVAGSIVSRQQDKDYEDYETLKLKAGRGATVFIDKGFTVTVSSSDSELATVGSAVEIFGQQRGKRFTAARVTVQLAGTLKSEDVLGKDAKGKKSTAKSKTKTKTKAKK